MGLLKFDGDGVRELYEHARGCTDFKGAYGQKPIPSLFLVHDDGVYLMSAGKPHLPNPDKPKMSKVVYAEGCNPDTDEDWWDASRALVGGDDFAEALPLDLFEAILSLGLVGIDIVINLGETRLTVSYTGGKKKQKQEPPEALPVGDDLDFGDF